MTNRGLLTLCIIWFLFFAIAVFYPTKEVDIDRIKRIDGTIVSANCVYSRSINMIQIKFKQKGNVKNIDASLPFEYECLDSIVETFYEKSFVHSSYNGFTLELRIGNEVIQKLDQGIENFNNQDRGRYFFIFVITVSAILFYFYRAHKHKDK